MLNTLSLPVLPVKQHASSSLDVHPAARDTEEIARLKQALAMLTTAKQTGKRPGLSNHITDVIDNPILRYPTQ